MRYEYSFFEIHRPELVEWLENNRISYQIDGGGNLPTFIKFTLWSNNTRIDDYLAQLEAMCVRRLDINAEYTSSEILNAKLLMINSKKQCIDILNHEEAYRRSCMWTNPYGISKVGHEEQQDLFVIANEPSTKTKTAFWHEDTGLAELFTDYRVFDLVKQNQLDGIDLKNVLLKIGKYSDKIYQMTSPNIINRKCIDFGHGEKKLNCPICGKEQFFINGAYQLHLYYNQIQVQSDLYVTERIFGEGIPEPLYLISQRFYRLLKENKLTGNLIISPVAEGV